MKALVVYGSKRGGTEGLADMVGQALTEQGIEVTVRSAAQRMPDLDSYDVVVAHMTFGGRLTPDAKGFPASAMAKKVAGDWRDEESVRLWATSIAASLT
jgi:menaquinone-dependent protoporphyrinogen IX oxidase